MQVFVCYFYLIRSQSIYYVFPICDTCVHVNTMLRDSMLFYMIIAFTLEKPGA